VLLVFALSPEDANYQQQLEQLSNHNELLERDLVLFHIFEMRSGFADEDILSEVESTQLRERFNVAQQAFTAVLIGKDGSEKQRWNEPIKSVDLFALIDEMPMRQQEMR
jgi:hypothetical protein